VATTNKQQSQSAGSLPGTGWPILLGAAITLAILALMFFTDSQQYVLAILQWIEQRRLLAPLLFIAIHALVVVLLLPGIVFTMGSGFLFGVVAGSFYVLISTCLGATVAFVLGRSVLNRPMQRLLAKRPRLQRILQVVQQRRWPVIALTRLMPFFPFKLSNYFFGASGFRLGSFIAGTAVGIIPITVLNVYFGSLAANLAMLDRRELAARGPIAWLLYGGGFVLSIAFALWLSRVARRELEKIS